MSDFAISKVTLHDLTQLQLISRQTFSETFADFNAAGDMQKYLEDNFGSEKLAAELINADSEFYFAYSGGQLAGYLKVNVGAAQSEMIDPGSLEIERIYVLAQHQGKKVGEALLKRAHQVAKSRKCGFVWLGVWEKNEKAIRFYQKHGFESFDTHIFKLGDDHQTDVLMRRSVSG